MNRRRRWRVCFFKQSSEGASWVRLGKAVERAADRIDIRLDSLPIGPFEGRLTLFAWSAGVRADVAPAPAPSARRVVNADKHKKMHFCEEGEAQSLCFAVKDTRRMTQDWKAVTCVRCLRRKAKMTEPMQRAASRAAPRVHFVDGPRESTLRSHCSIIVRRLEFRSTSWDAVTCQSCHARRAFIARRRGE